MILATAIRMSAVVWAVVFLSACLMSTPATVSHQYPSYRIQYVQYANTLGPVPVLLHGQPFAGSRIQQDSTIVAQMTPVASFPQIEFRPALASDPLADAFVVLALNPVNPGIAPHSLCYRRGVDTKRSGDGYIKLIAAFCQGDEALSYVRGSGPAGKGPDSQEFRATMAQVMADLLPRLEDNDRRDCVIPCP